MRVKLSNKTMKIEQKFNKLTAKEYRFYIDNHKKYTDFNTLGLYRSLLENEKLTLAEKLEVRDYAERFLTLWRARDPQIVYNGFDLANEDVLRKLAAALAKPRFYDAMPLIEGRPLRESLTGEPWDGPRLITREMLIAAGAIKDSSTKSKPRGGKSRSKSRGGKVERDLFSDLVDDEDQ